MYIPIVSDAKRIIGVSAPTPAPGELVATTNDRRRSWDLHRALSSAGVAAGFPGLMAPYAIRMLPQGDEEREQIAKLCEQFGAKVEPTPLDTHNDLQTGTVPK